MVRASSSAGSSPGMMWDQASIPDLRALSEEAALPSGEVGPVDFWALRRLAFSCAWVGMVQSQIRGSTRGAVSAVDGVDVVEGRMGAGLRGGVNAELPVIEAA